MSFDGTTPIYAYDHQNRRYKKTIAGIVTHYAWQGNQVIAEYNASTGAVLVDYIYSGGRMIAKVANNITNYFLSGGLSLRMTLNSNNTVAGRQAHLPFGEDFASSGPQQKQRFTTYERDNETATDYAINRRYQPTTGRFMQADPYRASGGAEDPQNWNRYAYAGNDPVNFTDPTGLNRVYFVAPCFYVLNESGCSNTYISMDGPGSNSSPEDGIGTGTDWQMKALKDAVEKVKKILGGDNKCSKFFGKNAVAALDALAKLWEFQTEGLSTDTGIKQIYDVSHIIFGPDGTPAYRLPTQAIVNRNGPLFLGTRGPGIGGYDRGSEGARIISILHEVAHNIITNQTGPPDYLIPGDGNDQDQSVKNTKTIVKHCSQEIFDAIK